MATFLEHFPLDLVLPPPLHITPAREGTTSTMTVCQRLCNASVELVTGLRPTPALYVVGGVDSLDGAVLVVPPREADAMQYQIDTSLWHSYSSYTAYSAKILAAS